MYIAAHLHKKYKYICNSRLVDSGDLSINQIFTGNEFALFTGAMVHSALVQQNMSTLVTCMCHAATLCSQ